MTFREELQSAYDESKKLAKTKQDREVLRLKFKPLFQAAKRSKDTIRLPVIDPLGLLSEATRGSTVELFDPLGGLPTIDNTPHDTLCDKLDDEEMLDFAHVVCRMDDNCVPKVYSYAIKRKNGEIDDANFNRSVGDILDSYAIRQDDGVDYSMLLKIRSPCFTNQILETCNYNPNCVERYIKLAEATSDPFEFARVLESIKEEE